MVWMGWLLTTAQDKDKQAAATRMQAAWRRHFAEKQLATKRSAAITLQRAARSSYWDVWHMWENPLTTMPGLVLERIAANGDKMRWASTTPGFAPHPIPANSPTVKRIGAVLLFVVLAAMTFVSTSHSTTGKPLAKLEPQPSMTQPSVVLLPGGGRVTLLAKSSWAGWLRNETCDEVLENGVLEPVCGDGGRVMCKRFQWSQSATTPSGQGVAVATAGARGKAIASLLYSAAAAAGTNASTALVDAKNTVVNGLRLLLKALLRRGGRLKRRAGDTARFLLQGFH